MNETGKQRLFTNLASSRHPVKALEIDYHEGMCELPADQVAKEVAKFRERHYSAHRMTLVLKVSKLFYFHLFSLYCARLFLRNSMINNLNKIFHIYGLRGSELLQSV